MDKKEKHIKENESVEKREHEELRHENVPESANRLVAEGKNRKNESTRRINKLWIWLGVLILIFILLWWIFGIGTAEDLTGITNG